MVIVRDAASGTWRLVEKPIEIVTASKVPDVHVAYSSVTACSSLQQS
jgi:hypothetical protein